MGGDTKRFKEVEHIEIILSRMDCSNKNGCAPEANVFIPNVANYKNNNLPNLEGHNLVFGWHAYLLYGKHKSDNLFKHHFIRNALFNIAKIC